MERGIFHTHGEGEAEVSIRRGVEVRGAHPPAALLLKHEGRARLNLSTLGPINSSLYVPAGWNTQTGRVGWVRKILYIYFRGGCYLKCVMHMSSTVTSLTV